MLQTIDLCATDEWFVCYKPIVYVIQTYRLCHTNLWFRLNRFSMGIITQNGWTCKPISIKIMCV